MASKQSTTATPRIPDGARAVLVEYLEDDEQMPDAGSRCAPGANAGRHRDELRVADTANERAPTHPRRA